MEYKLFPFIEKLNLRESESEFLFVKRSSGELLKIKCQYSAKRVRVVWRSCMW